MVTNIREEKKEEIRKMEELGRNTNWEDKYHKNRNFFFMILMKNLFSNENTTEIK